MYENLDAYIINEREKIYSKYRKKTFIDMYKKHKNKTCLCKSKNKICNINGKINLDCDDIILESYYDNGTLTPYIILCNQ